MESSHGGRFLDCRRRRAGWWAGDLSPRPERRPARGFLEQACPSADAAARGIPRAALSQTSWLLRQEKEVSPGQFLADPWCVSVAHRLPERGVPSVLRGLSWSPGPTGTPIPQVTVTRKRPSLLGAGLLVRNGFLGGLALSGCQPFSAEHLPKSVVCCSVTKLCLTLCDPMDCRTPGLPVHHQLPELTQTHVHRVSDAIQPSHPLSSPSPAFSLSQHQGLFQ